MANMTEEEFREKLDIVKEKYEVTEDELQKLIKETKAEIIKFFKMSNVEIPLINIFMKLKGKLDREKLKGGKPHLISVIRNSGSYQYFTKKPLEVRINRAAWKKDSKKAIADGLVTPDGYPIDNVGKIHKSRTMRMLTVGVIELDENNEPKSKVQISPSSLFDENALDFNPTFFTWLKVKGNFNPKGEFFNFNPNSLKEIKINGLKSIYDVIISKRKVSIGNNNVIYITLDKLGEFYEKCKKSYIPIKNGEKIEESAEYVLIEGNAIQIFNEKIITRGNKEVIKITMQDTLSETDTSDILRVAIPIYMPVNFAEDSRIAVLGKIRHISEEYGGGWSIWSAEAIYPIPGMGYMFEEESKIYVEGAEIESKGSEIVKPEIVKEEIVKEEVEKEYTEEEEIKEEEEAEEEIEEVEVEVEDNIDKVVIW